MLANIVLLCFALGFVVTKLPVLNMTRDVDGGEGEFKKLCALYGYYQFTADTTIVWDSDCIPGQDTPSNLEAHFYYSGGQCLVDAAYTNYLESWCITLPQSSSVVGNIYQSFENDNVPFGFTGGNYVTIDVYALSQSRPVIHVSDGCCLDKTPMVGIPVEDVNVVGLSNCASFNYANCYN